MIVAGRDGAGNAEKRAAEAAPRQAAWTPSERVLALTPKQVAETRERLSVVLEQDPSNKEPLIGPIESFDDMVRRRSCEPEHEAPAVPCRVVQQTPGLEPDRMHSQANDDLARTW